jgi:AbrB family looped-hinge helix DNA binding protein
MSQARENRDHNSEVPENMPDLDNLVHPEGIFRNEVEVNERGQIVIPAKIRDILGLKKNSRLRITLTKSGMMELQKVVHIAVDYSLEFDSELSGRVHAAYEKMEKGKVGDGKKLEALLK